MSAGEIERRRSGLSEPFSGPGQDSARDGVRAARWRCSDSAMRTRRLDNRADLCVGFSECTHPHSEPAVSRPPSRTRSLF